MTSGRCSTWAALVSAITLVCVAGGAQCPQETDTDGDGVFDGEDNCLAVANADQADADGEGVGDACDNCTNVSNGDQADADGNGVGDACELAGIWEKQSGTIYEAPYAGFVTRYLVLDADHTGRVLLRQEATNALACLDIIHFEPDGQSIAIDDPIYTGGGKTQFLLYAITSGGALELTDTNGLVSVFERRTAVPAELECHSFSVEQSFSGLSSSPTYASGLAFDGTKLWYSRDNPQKAVPVDPANGNLGTPIILNGGGLYVHAIQGADFWGFYNGSTAQRRTAADVLVDEIDTDVELGFRVYVGALAYDNNGVLWMFGSEHSDEDRRGHILKVSNPVGAPVLLSNTAFPLNLRSMTWDGTYLWAIYRQYVDFVVQIDLTTFQAVATYKSPDPSLFLNGIASVDGSFYIIGRDAADLGVLIKAAP
jgi:hypothetical protein